MNIKEVSEKTGLTKKLLDTTKMLGLFRFQKIQQTNTGIMTIMMCKN